MKVRARCGIAIYKDCLRLDVTWSGISYTHQLRSANNFTLFCFQKLSDRLSDKLEGFIGQI